MFLNYKSITFLIKKREEHSRTKSNFSFTDVSFLLDYLLQWKLLYKITNNDVNVFKLLLKQHIIFTVYFNNSDYRCTQGVRGEG